MQIGKEFDGLREIVRMIARKKIEENPDELFYFEEYEKIIDHLLEHKLPEKYPDLEVGLLGNFEHSMYSLFYRELVVAVSGYSALAYEWLRPLSEWIGKRPCLEIMSGSGSLSYGLYQCGVDIIATDNGERMKDMSIWGRQPWYDVECIDCLKALEKYGAERPIVICSWPEMNNTAYQALLKMREVNRQALMICIGERGGSITADEKFWNEAVYIENSEFEYAVSAYKPFATMSDYPYLIK